MDSRPFHQLTLSELRAPIAAYGLTVVATLLYIVSTATNNWIEGVISAQGVRYGLWKGCAIPLFGYQIFEDICGSLFPVSAFVHITRLCMVTACIAGCVTLIIPPLAYSGKIPQVGRAEIRKASHVVLVAASLVVIGTMTYVIGSAVDSIFIIYKLGYSIILGWISAAMAYVGGAILESQFKDQASAPVFVMSQQNRVACHPTTGEPPCETNPFPGGAPYNMAEHASHSGAPPAYPGAVPDSVVNFNVAQASASRQKQEHY
uniref:Claudin-7-like n=1 Tax=Saccoglossus kowalevskii TaxID=10224 RepID=A0ABM0GQ39_SACKO|nr:PREDICTED: claudin-7-like [Saccoglossus kowalevskii]